MMIHRNSLDSWECVDIGLKQDSGGICCSSIAAGVYWHVLQQDSFETQLD